MKIKKLATVVYFSNSLNHWPQRLCHKKASIETMQEQLVIVTSQLPVASSCINDIAKGQHFEIIRSGDRIKCRFMLLKPQESHKWSVHRLHGKCLVGIVQSVPSTSNSEDKADIFCNYIWDGLVYNGLKVEVPSDWYSVTILQHSDICYTVYIYFQFKLYPQ